jgi:general secretion pathway protein E
MRRPLPYAFARTHQLLLEDDGHTLTLWHSDAPDLSAWSEVTRRHTVQSFEYTDKATLAKRISEALSLIHISEPPRPERLERDNPSPRGAII